MRTIPRRLTVTGVALLAGLGVTAVTVPALAAQDPVLTPEQRETLQTQIDAYDACLAQQGVTRPDRSADGTRPDRSTITDEQRQQVRAAREACADQRPERPELSDEQRAALRAQAEEHRACMAEQLGAAGITRPEKPADGTASGERSARPQLSDEQKAAVEAARTACADLAPNLGVDGLGPRGGPGGPGGHGGRGGPGGPGGRAGGDRSPGTTTSAI